jgi:P27 family predicted phage terminase small subunit
MQGEGRPLAGEHLSREERDAFYKIVRSMPVGLFCEADTAALESWAHYLVEFRTCQKDIATTGLLVRGPNGPAHHPLISIRDNAARMLHKLGEALGLSPVARTRLTAADAFQNDPLTQLLDGMAEGAFTTPPPATKQ